MFLPLEYLCFVFEVSTRAIGAFALTAQADVMFGSMTASTSSLGRCLVMFECVLLYFGG